MHSPLAGFKRVPTSPVYNADNEEAKMNSLSREPNVIYVGRKPPMNYVLGIITSFSRSNTKEVTLKARGQAITTAVDAAEITRRRFMKDLSTGEITIGTEEMPPREGENRARMVSTHACAQKKKR
jgi:DNA-binding protein